MKVNFFFVITFFILSLGFSQTSYKMDRLIKPENLKIGDTISIIAPSGVLKDYDKYMDKSINLMQSWGLNVVLGSSIYDNYGHFSSEDINREIEALDKELKELNEKNQCTLIDIRDIRELWRDGTIKGALHIPRGMLEFWLDPESIYFKEGKLELDKEMVLFCAGGLRSALAAKTLKDMGFKKVSHIDGGFGALRQSKFKIV